MPGQTSQAYWTDRQIRTVVLGEKKTKEYERTLKAAYTNTKKTIQDQLKSFYQTYAETQGVSPADLRKRLTSEEHGDFKERVEMYQGIVKSLQSTGQSLETYKDTLRHLSARAYVSREEALMTNINHQLTMLAADTDQTMGKHLENTYEDSYYETAFHLSTYAQMGIDFNQPGQQQLKAAARTKWNGANYSDRIWNNKDKLMARLNVMIPQAFVRGAPSAVLARELAEEMDVAYSSAVRLVRTESRYVGNKGTKDAYIESGVVDQLMFMATLDGRTSVICQEMDGKIMDVKDGDPGTTMPPLHPYCRSTTIPYFPDDDISDLLNDRVERKDGKTKSMGRYKTYKDWAVDNAPKSYVNRLTDDVAQMPVDPGTELDNTPLMEMVDRTEGLLFDPDTRKVIKVDDTIGEFEQELYEFTAGASGYSDATKAFLDNDIKHLNKLRPGAKAAAARMLDLIDRAPVYSKPLYRIEESDVNRGFELKPGTEFTMGMRSFTRSKMWLDDLIAGNDDADFDDPVVFKTTGVKAMNMRPYSYFSRQEESVTAGKFKIIGVKVETMGGRRVKVIEIEQLSVKPPKAGPQPFPDINWNSEFNKVLPYLPSYVNVGEDGISKQSLIQQLADFDNGDEETKKSIAKWMGPNYLKRTLQYGIEEIDTIEAFGSWSEKNPQKVMDEIKKQIVIQQRLLERASGGFDYNRYEAFDDESRAYLRTIAVNGKASVLRALDAIKTKYPEETVRDQLLLRSQQAAGGNAGEDILMKAMLEKTDGAKLAELVSPTTYRNMIERKGFIAVHRGVNGEQFVEDYKKGSLYFGKGIYGNGTYVAIDRDTAATYGNFKKKNIIAMAIKPNAKLISHGQIAQLAGAVSRYSGGKTDDLFGVDTWGISRDDARLLTEDGRLAAALGFDGIHVDDANYLVMLTRSSMVISDEPIAFE